MKKFCVLILFIIFAIFMIACELEEEKEGEIPSKLTSTGVVDYVDPETGVHYLIYSCSYQGGITVRYNADGTIMVDPIK